MDFLQTFQHYQTLIAIRRLYVNQLRSANPQDELEVAAWVRNKTISQIIATVTQEPNAAVHLHKAILYCIQHDATVTMPELESLITKWIELKGPTLQFKCLYAEIFCYATLYNNPGIANAALEQLKIFCIQNDDSYILTELIYHSNWTSLRVLNQLPQVIDMLLQPPFMAERDPETILSLFNDPFSQIMAKTEASTLTQKILLLIHKITNLPILLQIMRLGVSNLQRCAQSELEPSARTDSRSMRKFYVHLFNLELASTPDLPLEILEKIALRALGTGHVAYIVPIFNSAPALIQIPAIQEAALSFLSIAIEVKFTHEVTESLKVFYFLLISSLLQEKITVDKKVIAYFSNELFSKTVLPQHNPDQHS